MRKLKADPIPDEVLYQVLEAGTRAPSGTNTQHWRFIVVKDPAVKKQVQADLPERLGRSASDV
jgi:nitroreductase